MRTAIAKEKRRVITRIHPPPKRKDNGLIVSKTREWKLLYSPLTNCSQSRPGPEEKDLCASCRNNEICTYPKPEGGVWHCKDYK